jgi:hypothetical protein
VVAVLVLTAVVITLLTSQRHRSFYFGQVASGAGSPAAASLPPVANSPSAAGSVTPAGSPPVAGAASAGNSPSASPGTLATGRPMVPPARPTGALATEVSLPTTDASGRVRVPVSDRAPANVPADGIPTGWELKEFVGQSSVELVRGETGLAIRLRSDKSSFALHRDVVLDIRRQPILTWSWKVARLPAAGDVRDPQRDDQAAQLYVVFPRWPSPRTSSDVIGYVWDSRAPVGTTLVHPRAPNVRIVVVESGPAKLGTWVREQRNVAADFKALFGREPTRLGKVAIMTDSNDTRGDAEVLFGDLIFGPADTAVHTEIPTPMLR